MEDREINGTVFSEFGEKTAPAIILIHGLGLNKDVWQWQVAALSQHHRVVSYDLFGHAKSKAPPATPSLKLFANQTQTLMNYTGIENATVIGFSLGGMIARRIAQDAPQRVNSLVILHSPHKRSAAAQRAILDRVAQARDQGSAATVEAALERWFTAPFRHKNPKLMELVRAWVLDNKQDIYHTIYQVLATGIDEITNPTPAISCPTLVITGDEDFGNGPDMARAIANDINGAELHILNGLRHMALAENPAAVTQPILRFLTSHLRTPIPRQSAQGDAHD